MKPKTLKLLEENYGSVLQDRGVSKDSTEFPRINPTTDIQDIIKLKILWIAKKIIK